MPVISVGLYHEKLFHMRTVKNIKGILWTCKVVLFIPIFIGGGPQEINYVVVFWYDLKMEATEILECAILHHEKWRQRTVISYIIPIKNANIGVVQTRTLNTPLVGPGEVPPRDKHVLKILKHLIYLGVNQWVWYVQTSK